MTSIMFYLMTMICMIASLWCMFADNYQMATYCLVLAFLFEYRGDKTEKK